MTMVPRRFILIACAQKKLARPAFVCDLYTSPLFKMSVAYAETLRPRTIFVLSAKYGLLQLHDIRAPYERTLNTMSSAAVRTWSKRVLMQLRDKTNVKKDEFVFLAGERYRKFLVPHLRNTRVPLAGLTIGKQLQFLKRALAEAA